MTDLYNGVAAGAYVKPIGLPTEVTSAITSGDVTGVTRGFAKKTDTTLDLVLVSIYYGKLIIARLTSASTIASCYIISS